MLLRLDSDFPRGIRWHKEGILDRDALVTERVKLDEMNEATDRLRRGEIAGRSIIEF